MARAKAPAANSATGSAGVATRRSAARSPPSTRTVPVMVCTRTPVTSAGTCASALETKPSASVITAAGNSSPARGTTTMLAGSASTMARWKYQAMGSASATCITAEMASTS
jgi:hypothetical protein